MKQVLLVLYFLVPTIFFAQIQLNVSSSETGKPIAKANIYCDDVQIATTNAAGSAVFKTKCREVEVSADNFDQKTVKVEGTMSVKLLPASEKTRNIQNIVIKDQSDPRALRILEEVNKRYKENSPKSLDGYNFLSYSKISMDLDKDSIGVYQEFMKRRADSIAATPAKNLKQSEKKKKDSLMGEAFFNAGTTSQFFMWEKAQQHQFSKKFGEKIVVLDNKVSGFQNPLYEFMAMNISNLDRIPRQINPDNRELYRFFLSDTVQVDGRDNFVIKFRQRESKQKENPRKFNGLIYVDAETYALKQIESKSKKANEGNVTSVWTPIAGKWFLEREDIRFKMGSQRFATAEKPKTTDKKMKDSADNKKKYGKNFDSYVYVKNRFFDFKINPEQDSKDFKGYTYSVNAADGSILDKYRTDSLTARERSTYKNIDSLTQKLDLEKKLSTLTNLLKGKIRLGKVDLDPTKLINYNLYEGWRLGLGAKLNEKFNKTISPDAYFAYGFHDHRWKFGTGVDFRLSTNRNSIFRVQYVDDVSAVGMFSRNMWNRFTTLFDMGSYIYNANFFHYNGFGVSYEYDLANSLTGKLAVNRQKQEAKFDYFYKNQPNAYTDFSTMLTLRYSPKDKNIMTPGGKFTFETGYPQFIANVELGSKIFGGTMSYSRFDLVVTHQFRTKLGTTNLKLFGGVASGTAPIWKDFEIAGLTSPSRNDFLSKLSLESNLSFYAMPSATFYVDKFVGLQLTQRLPFSFKTIGKRSSWLDFRYNSAIGGFKNPQVHAFNFQVLDHYYQEAGLQWHNFLGSRYTVGVFYKFGYYNEPGLMRNVGFVLGF